MCNIGSVVYRDCAGDFSTTCIPCLHGKFMDKPNGVYDCSICKHCSERNGLYIQSKCTTIQNSICDVLDGYHCIDNTSSECQHALKHSECKPGQESKTPGTKRSDTVCVDCPSGFYSSTGENCTRWRDCAAKNEIKTEAGNSIKDVTCTQQNRGRYGVIAAVSVFIAILPIMYCIRLQMKKLKQRITSRVLSLPIEETVEGCHSSTTHHMLEENK
ncbi:tumor necrosis factor receptor superfamily member 5-like isoform X2 [Triplophysa rosa]|nr:tumor necrosis factor receptor superfamily member 5-like isoform X2 [Triplophysa rosa]XP_057212640.1 tumor necrosis factor receptor superfamily member 5-like isoform X2 [Triplophysa rosa]